MKIKRKFKVGLDATCITDRPSGAKQRFIGLYSELVSKMQFVDFIIFEPSDSNLKFLKYFKKYKNVNFIKTPIKSKNSIINILKSFFYWRNKTKSLNLDILESFRLPFFKNYYNRSILTIHDLRFLYWQFSGYKKFFNYLYCKFFLNKVDHFIVVSKATKNQLISLLGNKNITVVENGIDIKDFKKIKKKTENEIKKKYNIYSDFIFTVGHFENRKNYLNLILSMKNINNQKIKLIIAGNASSKKETKYKEKLQNTIFENKLNYRVLLLSNVSNEEIKSLYAMSKLFVFPSVYEGFGIPILEAMAYNKKIVLSNIEPFREIINYDKKIFFDPENIKDISNKIKMNLNKTNIERNKYSSSLKSHKYEILASKIYKLYINLIKKK